MKRTTRALCLLASAAVLAGARPAHSTTAAAIFAQGPKLLGAGVTGSIGAQQGASVALSADGNTAIVGGTWDDTQLGAAWVFTRFNGVWQQQQKLIGSGAVGIAYQGASVALSADGNTAIVGGPFDSSSVGAAWVFTRSGNVWTQQGNKLVGTGGYGASKQGVSVALSADGNTALVGGSGDNGGSGAAWVFTRSNGAWSQQGDKLYSTDKLGLPQEGTSVALSADGDTAIIGGVADDSNAGAVWIFVRSEGSWSPQGGKLHAIDANGPAQLGTAVALSSDGNTAIVGGPGDDAYKGAAWIFSRSGTSWTQDGDKIVRSISLAGEGGGTSVAISGDGETIVMGCPAADGSAGGAWVFTKYGNIWLQRGARIWGTAAIGGAYQGQSVALSADGTTAMLGGPSDSSLAGAAWIFRRFGSTGDVNGDAATNVSDVFYLINFLFAGGPAPQ